MARDPIVEEVRAIRQAIAEEHGNDLDAIVRHFDVKMLRMAFRLFHFPRNGCPKMKRRVGLVKRTAQHAMEPTARELLCAAAHR